MQPLRTTTRDKQNLVRPIGLGSTGSTLIRAAGLLLIFTLLTIFMTWPLPLHAGSAIQDLGDPLHEIWTMRWTQHQLLTNPAHLWDGNMGYPFPDSLLFSEPRLSTSILAWPIQLATGNDVLTYNLMFLLSFIVLGTGMALLVVEITGSAGVGLLAGILAAYTPYRYGHLSHLNLLNYGWTPLALWALIRFARRRRPIDAGLAALFLTIQLPASDTIALMTLGMIAVLLPLLLLRERRRLSRQLFAGLAIALVIPLLAMVPDILGRIEVDRLYGFTRSLDTVRRMAATPWSYISVCGFDHFWRDILPHAYPNPLFPGALALLGALLGLILAVRRWPSWVIYCVILASAAFVLSLGPDTTIHGTTYTLPYRWLYDSVPGMTAFRDVARFGMVVVLAIDILAGLGFAAAWALLRSRLPVNRIRMVGGVILIILVALSLTEFKSDVGAKEVPRDPQTVAVYDWLAKQPRGPVMEFPANGLWAGAGPMLRQIYYSTRHWQPIVAAHTSFLPDRYMAFMLGFHGGTTASSLVTPANVGLLQDIGIHYVVIHRLTGYDWPQALHEANSLPELTRIGTFGNAEVYTLAPGHRTPVELKLAAPEFANAGQPVMALLIASNHNTTGAITTLKRPPSVSATWIDAQGRVISMTEQQVKLPVIVPDGGDNVPIRLTAPSTPGTYRLRLSAGSLVTPLEAQVRVEPVTPPNANRPPITLRQVTWPDRPYQPGEDIDLLLEWDVNRPVEKSYTFTTQLQGSGSPRYGQRDDIPFRGTYPTSQWKPGETILEAISIPVEPDTPPGSYQLLIALYDGSQPSDPRLTIALPDGTTGPEGTFGPISIQGR